MTIMSHDALRGLVGRAMEDGTDFDEAVTRTAHELHLDVDQVREVVAREILTEEVKP